MDRECAGQRCRYIPFHEPRFCFSSPFLFPSLPCNTTSTFVLLLLMHKGEGEKPCRWARPVFFPGCCFKIRACCLSERKQWQWLHWLGCCQFFLGVANKTTEPFSPNQYASVDWMFMTVPHQRPRFRDHNEESASDDEHDLWRCLGGLWMKTEFASTRHLH
ncbi:hypothetical protein BC830DRAFT_525470 [Chytriomyces sp. MP71]|nr:hypothetical protein BC830DRAFT_525470 [Chytriomyces sp. MP71]